MDELDAIKAIKLLEDIEGDLQVLASFTGELVTSEGDSPINECIRLLAGTKFALQSIYGKMLWDAQNIHSGATGEDGPDGPVDQPYRKEHLPEM